MKFKTVSLSIVKYLFCSMVHLIPLTQTPNAWVTVVLVMKNVSFVMFKN